MTRMAVSHTRPADVQAWTKVLVMGEVKTVAYVAGVNRATGLHNFVMTDGTDWAWFSDEDVPVVG